MSITSTSLSTVVEVRPEHGGKDAQDFADSLVRSLSSALSRSGFAVRIEPFSQVQRSFLLFTSASVQALAWLQGLHVVTRIPKGSSARHTSAATVIIRPDREMVSQVDIPAADVRIDRYRGHGAGGQRKNKVSTAIRVVHLPTGIVITRETGRSQSDNLESAMEDLRQRLITSHQQMHQQQVNASREVINDANRTFTHNYQRGEVIAHRTGRKYSTKTWEAGRFDILGN